MCVIVGDLVFPADGQLRHGRTMCSAAQETVRAPCRTRGRRGARRRSVVGIATCAIFPGSRPAARHHPHYMVLRRARDVAPPPSSLPPLGRGLTTRPSLLKHLPKLLLSIRPQLRVCGGSGSPPAIDGTARFAWTRSRDVSIGWSWGATNPSSVRGKPPFPPRVVARTLVHSRSRFSQPRWPVGDVNRTWRGSVPAQTAWHKRQQWSFLRVVDLFQNILQTLAHS